MTASPGAPGTGPPVYQPAFQELTGKFSTPARFTPTPSTARCTSRAGIRSCKGLAVGIGACGGPVIDPAPTTNGMCDGRSPPLTPPAAWDARAGVSDLTTSPAPVPSRHDNPSARTRTTAKATALRMCAYCCRRELALPTIGDAARRLGSSADIVTALAPAREPA